MPPPCTPPTYKHTERDLITHSPLKANVEPFFKCIKESKGLPLQTTASGSGASVVAVTGKVVVPAVGSLVPVVPETSSGGGTICETGVIGMPGIFWNMMSISCGVLIISRGVSGRRCGLGLKSEVGFSWRLLKGDGVVPWNSSSSSSANTNVSPRAEGEKAAWATLFACTVSAQDIDMFQRNKKKGFLTHHATCGLKIRAAALVILAHGVTLALPLWVKSIFTTTHARLWRWKEELKEYELSLLLCMMHLCTFSVVLHRWPNLFPPFNNYIQSDFNWLTLPWGFDSMPLGSCDNVVPY